MPNRIGIPSIPRSRSAPKTEIEDIEVEPAANEADDDLIDGLDGSDGIDGEEGIDGTDERTDDGGPEGDDAGGEAEAMAPTLPDSERVRAPEGAEGGGCDILEKP